MTRAFVTGVTGQDGTYLARALLEEGVEVHGLVRPGSNVAVETGITVHTGDVQDLDSVSDLIRQLRPDEVYHLAAQSSVAESWEDPVAAIDQSGRPTAGLLQAAWELDTPVRFVLACSAEIFGRTAAAPQDESTPVAPASPYGVAKALAHHLVGVFRDRGMHASSCILYNHESPLRPDRFVTRKITRAAARIARGQGDTLRLGNLDVARDWGWAPDYVEAMQAAVRHPDASDYVIGTGETHTVREFAAAAFAAAGIADWERHVEVDPELFRPVDPGMLRADSSKARDALQWRPRVSFEELVERMVHADLRLIDAS